jgi:HK97 family phage prohead protease
MTTLGTIRGYANVFDEFSTKLDGDEPLRERIRPGAFQLLHHPITATVAHCSAPFGTTWNKSLRLWQDSRGLAFEADIEATVVGTGLRDLVASGFDSMSFGLINLESHYFRDEDALCRDITRCDLNHVSVVHQGAFESACCWLADMPAENMSPRIRNASLRWRLGKIAHEEKRAREREIVARYLAAKAAPSRRRPRGKAEPILIDGLEPYEFLRRYGATYEWQIPEGF